MPGHAAPLLAADATATALAAEVAAQPVSGSGAAAAAICLGGTILTVVLGKYARDLLLLRRGIHPEQAITRDDNVAVAIETAGFALAVVIGLLGSFAGAAADPLGLASELLLTALLVNGLLLVNDRLTTHVLLRGLDADKEVGQKGNIAVALVRTASALATAQVLRGALGHDSALLDRVLWALIGQVGLYALSVVHQRITHYDDLAELRKRNVAAAWPMAGILIAAGIIVDASLRGSSEGWVADLMSVGLDLLVSAVLLHVLRLGADALFLPGARFHDEIAKDHNVGAGVLEAAGYVGSAMAVAWFLV